MKKLQKMVMLTSIVFIMACNTNKKTFDASGSFEAEEVIISAETTGMIKAFNLEEGQTLKAGDKIGYIDTTQLYLKKIQLEAQIKSVGSRTPNITEQTQSFDAQMATTKTQLEATMKEQKRFENLVKNNAATQKQLDDITAQVEVLKKQIAALQAQKNAQISILNTNSQSIQTDKQPIQIQIAQIEDQLAKSRIINPINGTVLTKYATIHEMALAGKALYKIADLSTILLRAYISGNQLAQIKLNQKVKVFTDDGKGGFKEAEGTLTWISDKAEFTPKTIQTKNERANLVYATKVKVLNDGSYKIGMYGEIKFQ